ncbi:MAG: hypothetical protein GY793_06240 [Proteobacteria bacterium]|nr:hypothetical protein [Pseudomonadota bacterium]
MSDRSARRKIKFLVIISTLIIIGIWITWLVIYKPYSRDNKNKNSNIFSNINNSTEDIKNDIKNSQQQLEVLQKFFERDKVNSEGVEGALEQIKTQPTATSTKNTIEIKNAIRDLITTSSTSATTTDL